MLCLETTDLRYRYPSGASVLQGIDLQVPEGGIYGFLGPNGAGKTTTLRLVMGLMTMQQGTISIFGKPFAAHRIEILRNVGSLIESPSLYEHLTAAENLTILRRIYRCPKARIAEVLELVGLSDVGNKRTGAFSLGMKQRLGIAAALLHRPALLILDEPTNGLDPNGIIEMRHLLLRLSRESGVTILISSHLLAEIERLVTHVGIIHRGRMMFQGTMDELRRKQEQVVAVSVGTSDDETALAIVAEQVPAARIARGRLVMPAISNEHIAAINRLLVGRGVDVHEIRPVSNDLESIFMDLIGERAS
jgi:ABC-2 type transport system ATP-binding protein